MHRLVLVRHGESTWNNKNLFTGWTDVDLSDKGDEEAREAGRTLKREGHVFDIAFTSVLKRAIRTLWIILDEMDLMWIPVHRDWRLNERHYGALQGLNKSQMAERFGKEQVHAWRRSYAVRPPALEEGDERNPANDPRDEALRTLHRDLPAPVTGESNDGVVPVLSQVWGDCGGAVVGDHLDVVGQFQDQNAGNAYTTWLFSGSGFNEDRFRTLWSRIADVIAGVQRSGIEG